MRVDPKFKSSAPELKSWVYKFINNFPDLLNLNDIKKRAVKKVGISQIRNEIKKTGLKTYNKVKPLINKNLKILKNTAKQVSPIENPIRFGKKLRKNYKK